ncbi:uncharacterized protein Tco025E_06740 [Trypanosoma conorhini]|uniref:Uncharacterized protein n=1 Tax=Trypanosoma conorhini TaxID=83891 RepID=A0A3R7N1G9_9TRYP|nr:uncharacterized protein Tco025E_06740 [Trypanosoma conorhini]RNF11287.1 hypothetical protein Tco025E_06740 [Trypanosoma conorhini]
MSAGKRGSDPLERGRGGGRWAPQRSDPRRVAAEEDHDEYEERRRPHDHRSRQRQQHHLSSGGTRRPSSRHERRRKRSRGLRADYDSASDTSAPSGDWEEAQHHSHRRRTRQRRESSPHRRHRHRRRSASSSSSCGRGSRRPQRQQEQRRPGDEEPRGTGRRARIEEDAPRSVTPTAAERRQQQLLSALDSQLASYRGRGRGVVAANYNDASNGGRTQHEGQGQGDAAAPSTRVVLYGVDLGVQPCHLNSMLEQLVGRRPLSVFRPAAVLRQSFCDTAPTGEGASPGTLPVGVGADSCLRLGLYDVGGAGGVVVMELPRDVVLVESAVAALNGAYVNGSPIAAVAGC